MTDEPTVGGVLEGIVLEGTQSGLDRLESAYRPAKQGLECSHLAGPTPSALRHPARRNHTERLRRSQYRTETDKTLCPNGIA